jgi:hypothetical protein
MMDSYDEDTPAGAGMFVEKALKIVPIGTPACLGEKQAVVFSGLPPPSEAQFGV